VKKITQIFVFVAVAIIAIYDLIAFASGGTGATISCWFWEVSKVRPVIPFAAGFIAGHLFWQDPRGENK
jgi:zinc transporter ZupT